MSEDARDDLVVADEGDDAELAAAARTDEWQQLVDAAEQSGPGPRARCLGCRLVTDGPLPCAASRAADGGVGPEVADGMQGGCVHMDEDTSQELEWIETWPVRVDGRSSCPSRGR